MFRRFTKFPKNDFLCFRCVYSLLVVTWPVCYVLEFRFHRSVGMLRNHQSCVISILDNGIHDREQLQPPCQKYIQVGSQTWTLNNTSSYHEEGWYEGSNFNCLSPSSQEVSNPFEYGIMKSKSAQLVKQDLVINHVEGFTVVDQDTSNIVVTLIEHRVNSFRNRNWSYWKPGLSYWNQFSQQELKLLETRIEFLEPVFVTRTKVFGNQDWVSGTSFRNRNWSFWKPGLSFWNQFS